MMRIGRKSTLKILVVALAAAAPVAFAQDRGAAISSTIFNAYEVHRQRAILINKLAGNIQSLDDSRELVGLIAGEFHDELPPSRELRKFEEKLAQAEYATATGPGNLIPEERIADAWNRYVREIGAPQEAEATAQEIHNLRDGLYTNARFAVKHGQQTIWTMPNIYALGPDGKVADGCRGLETVMVLWQITNEFENLRGARERLRQGILLSDILQRTLDAPAGERSFSMIVLGRLIDNPVDAAARRYVSEHGARKLMRAIEAMADEIYPAAR